MFVRPLRFESRLPVSVSQTIVSVSKPPVAIRFPSSLKLTIASPYAAKAPLFGTFNAGNSRCVAVSHILTV
jgi:hypothetical protein